MLRFTFFTRLHFYLLVVVPLTMLGCRKKIDFEGTNSYESGTLHPLQQYYEPWETVSVTTKGTPYLIEANNSYLYTASDDGDRRWVQRISPSHSVHTLFYSQTYYFTSLNKASGTTNMVLGARGGLYCVATFNSNGIVNNYPFYVPLGRKINSIYDNGVRFYIGGNFLNAGTNPMTSYADQIFWSSGTIYGTPGLIKEVLEMDRIDFAPYACGNGILPTGHSIAEWTGTAWEARTPVMNEKVTAIEQIGDTLFIAGFDANEFAIKKFANGNLITDTTIINTASSLASSNVKMLSHNGVLYVYGTVNFPEKFYIGVLKYVNGQWSYVGKLGGIPEDVTIFNGHLYALVNGTLKRYPL